jgi:hypothetical protein
VIDQILVTRRAHTGGFYVFALGNYETNTVLPILRLGTTLVNVAAPHGQGE